MGRRWRDVLVLDLTPVLIAADKAVIVGLVLTELVINGQIYSPLYDDEGQIAGLLNIVDETTRDVKTRHKLGWVQGELAAEREQLATMFEQAPSFIAVVSGPDHTFTMANPSYRKLVGHRELIGRTVPEALPDAVAQGYVDLLDRVYRSGETYTAGSRRVRYSLNPAARS